MSDHISRLLAGYAASIQPADLDPIVVHEVKRRVLDTLGVGLAAF